MSCIGVDEQVSTTSSASTVLRHLLWDVNRNVIEETKDLLLFHASAVEQRRSRGRVPGADGVGEDHARLPGCSSEGSAT